VWILQRRSEKALSLVFRAETLNGLMAGYGLKDHIYTLGKGPMFSLANFCIPSGFGSILLSV
jgi:hypothetical protein